MSDLHVIYSTLDVSLTSAIHFLNDIIICVSRTYGKLMSSVKPDPLFLIILLLLVVEGLKA